MKKTRQEIAWIIICIITCIITIPIFIFNVILSIQALTTPNKLPAVFGISPTVVASGSMSPEFEKNDLIFIQGVDTDTLKEKEDVICFVTSDGDYVTHRINRIVVVDGVKHFYTKGDANNAEDKGYILADQIQGKYVYKIASIGGVVTFMQTPYGMVMVVILLLIIYIGGELLIEIVLQKKTNKLLTEENEELKAELKQLRALTYSLAKEEVAQTMIDEEIAELKAMIYSSAKEDVVAERKEEKETAIEEIEIAEQEVVPVEKVAEQEETNIFDSINSQKIPFAKKVLALKDEAKQYFVEVHNELVSYKKVNARLSCKAMSYRVGRKLLAKFTVRGKTLTLNLALDVNEFDKNVFFQKDTADIKAYSQVPFAVKVKSDRGAKNAQKLVLAIAEKENLKKDNSFTFDDVISTLVAYKEEVKESKEEIKPLVEETDQIIFEDLSQFIEEDQTNNEGEQLEMREENIFDNIKSKKMPFEDKIVGLKDEVKAYFNCLHNELISYKKVNARLSNKAMSYRVGRKLLAKFTVRGKTLTFNLALAVSEFDKNIFFQVDTAGKKAYEEVPFAVKVKSDRGLKNAQKLIVALSEKENLKKDKKKEYEDIIALLSNK